MLANPVESMGEAQFAVLREVLMVCRFGAILMLND
jgi:hypothetical protein